MQPAPTPAVRRRDAARTKAAIVGAAQRLFAERGYARTGLREIAAEASVAVSLLPQHFGCKAELFEATLVNAMAGSPMFSAPRSEWGRAMIDHVCGGGDVQLAAMVILSTGDAEAREITARVVRERVVAELAERLGPPNAVARAMQITMLGTGFLLYARQLPIGPVDATTRERFAAMLQAVIDS